MPKGDRLKLKADPEDGTTPIANLLLEAVAMAKISGLQTRVIIYLWRVTYGWVGKEGKRLKEAKIPLSEWARALNSNSSRLSHALSELEGMKIINRRLADMWGGYYYSLNTDISQWNSNTINLARLAEKTIVADFGTVDKSATIDQNATVDKSATIDQNNTQQLPKTQQCTLYKEILNKRRDDKKLSSPMGEKVKEVFARLDKERGYRPPKRKAEAASIIRMLKLYEPDQIITTYQSLKRDKFWEDKELFMMAVESQIGAIVSKKKKENVRW